MKLKVFFVFLVIHMSCTDKNTETEEIEFLEASELVSQNEYTDLLSFKSNRNKDIVDHLFNEAMKKDDKLLEINNEIALMPKVKKDSLSFLKEYIDYNFLYFSSFDEYANKIIDQDTKKLAEEILKKSKENYNNTLIKNQELRSITNELEKELNDRSILLKLIVTHNLINKYQTNSPRPETIKELNEKYQILIDEIQNYNTN